MVTYVPTILMNLINQAIYFYYCFEDTNRSNISKHLNSAYFNFISFDLVVTVNVTCMMVLASVYLSGQLYKIIKIFDNNITISVNKLTQHFCHKASRGLAPLQPCLPIPYYNIGYHYPGRFIFVVFLFDKLYFCRKSPEQKLLKVLSNQ